MEHVAHGDIDRAALAFVPAVVLGHPRTIHARERNAKQNFSTRNESVHDCDQRHRGLHRLTFAWRQHVHPTRKHSTHEARERLDQEVGHLDVHVGGVRHRHLGAWPPHDGPDADQRARDERHVEQCVRDQNVVRRERVNFEICRGHDRQPFDFEPAERPHALGK
ncbi:hypothetical protein H310_02861 [Aphanomyces invadans]|uniref:Uncharacterized protein n=1 Tax=Aphanomyces invadans TaxID=157072 RepID=A0A024UK43_9STRA|nr:hypothetical protein H310_02861 [Aphanomyces invadans]ETW06679.1 hypothetical protein H310_02861 [Aphanomyces invadans]|eukprot:XP_008864754.1 hypothetical protein H310_02861 [Aphanomyces invadans]